MPLESERVFFLSKLSITAESRLEKFTNKTCCPTTQIWNWFTSTGMKVAAVGTQTAAQSFNRCCRIVRKEKSSLFNFFCKTKRTVIE